MSTPIENDSLGRGLLNPIQKSGSACSPFRKNRSTRRFCPATRAAVALRDTVAPMRMPVGWFMGEDLLPGLVVDRFAEVAVMQALGYGSPQRLLADLLMQEAG